MNKRKLKKELVKFSNYVYSNIFYTWDRKTTELIVSKYINLPPISNTEESVVLDFVTLLKNKGVNIDVKVDGSTEYVIKDSNGFECINLCIDDGKLNRVMGYTKTGYNDEIHKE